MKIFQITDWSNTEISEHKGETGMATIKSVWLGKIQIREIEYSPNYRADHWCGKGHIIYCLEGEYELHLKDGTIHKLAKGSCYQATDNEENPHLAASKSGCKIFVVDGDFLNSRHFS